MSSKQNIQQVQNTEMQDTHDPQLVSASTAATLITDGPYWSMCAVTAAGPVPEQCLAQF